MAVTITRSVWIDDDGTGTTGTVINQALHTTLYNEIDTALAKVAQLAGGNTFTGAQTINGVLQVVGFGQHTFIASGTGAQTLIVQNTLAGAGNYAFFGLGNDASNALLSLFSFASTYAAAGDAFANGSTIRQGGVGGLTLATSAAAPVRVFTNGAERLRIATTGELLINTTTNPGVSTVMMVGNWGAGVTGLGMQNTAVANNGFFAAFFNSAAGVAGSISQTGAASVAYNTTSDARLKDDDGRAIDLTALRAVTVHDFRWKADGVRDRGIFAQDAHALYPRAVVPGTDDRTEDGALARPWMTDYSKFVADLIVGWQQHDAEIAALRDQLATLKG